MQQDTVYYTVIVQLNFVLHMVCDYAKVTISEGNLYGLNCLGFKFRNTRK